MVHSESGNCGRCGVRRSDAFAHLKSSEIFSRIDLVLSRDGDKGVKAPSASNATHGSSATLIFLFSDLPPPSLLLEDEARRRLVGLAKVDGREPSGDCGRSCPPTASAPVLCSSVATLPAAAAPVLMRSYPSRMDRYDSRAVTKAVSSVRVTPDPGITPWSRKIATTLEMEPVRYCSVISRHRRDTSWSKSGGVCSWLCKVDPWTDIDT